MVKFKVGDVVKKIKDKSDSTSLYFDKPYIIREILEGNFQAINVFGSHKAGEITWWICEECLGYYEDSVCNTCKNDCSVEGLEECVFYEEREKMEE